MPSGEGGRNHRCEEAFQQIVIDVTRLGISIHIIQGSLVPSWCTRCNGVPAGIIIGEPFGCVEVQIPI
jgi:hypothetical protein